MNTDDKHRPAALHLMRALVEGGAQPDEPMANARITELAISVGLEDERLPALEYAGHQGWLDSEGARPGWTKITAAGIAAGKENR